MGSGNNDSILGDRVDSYGLGNREDDNDFVGTTSAIEVIGTCGV